MKVSLKNFKTTIPRMRKVFCKKKRNIYLRTFSVTSRPPRVLEENGKNYWFTDRTAMEQDVREHRYLEHGEHGGHLYGTKLDSIRELIRAGKMCVLDCSPAALKMLHNSTEFMPYVIFIAAPGMEQLKYLYDMGRSTGTSNRNLTVRFCQKIPKEYFYFPIKNKFQFFCITWLFLFHIFIIGVT